MAVYLTNTNDLTVIADAIRAKSGTSAPLEFPQGMADAVAAISGGGGGEIALEIVNASNPVVHFGSGSGPVRVWGFGESGSGFQAAKYAFTGDQQYRVSVGSSTPTTISPTIGPSGSITGLPSMTSGQLLITRGNY